MTGLGRSMRHHRLVIAAVSLMLLLDLALSVRVYQSHRDHTPDRARSRIASGVPNAAQDKADGVQPLIDPPAKPAPRTTALPGVDRGPLAPAAPGAAPRSTIAESSKGHPAQPSPSAAHHPTSKNMPRQPKVAAPHKAPQKTQPATPPRQPVQPTPSPSPTPTPTPHPHVPSPVPHPHGTPPNHHQAPGPTHHVHAVVPAQGHEAKHSSGHSVGHGPSNHGTHTMTGHQGSGHQGSGHHESEHQGSDHHSHGPAH